MTEDPQETITEEGAVEKTEEQNPSVKNLVILVLKVFGFFTALLILTLIVPKPNFKGETIIIINNACKHL